MKLKTFDPAPTLKPRLKATKRSLRSNVPVKGGGATSKRTGFDKAIFDKAAYKPDARALAVIRGVEIAEKILRMAGGAFDLQEVQTLMHGISRQAVDKRVQDGSLLAVPGPNNRRSYPTLQFDRHGTLVSGLKEVRKALPTANPWTILGFLASSDDRLDGRKPIDLLKEGNIALVVESARRLGQQGG